MAWTAPMTFTAGQPLTAAQLNTHLRDNMFESEAAKVTEANQYLLSNGRNQLVARKANSARVNADESTTLVGNYVELDTIGPQVTVDTGTRAMVLMSAGMYNANANSATGMSFAVDGLTPDGDEGTSIEPKDSRQCMVDGVAANSGVCASNMVTLTVVEGSNTFTCWYKIGSGTGHWRYRHICVIPW